MNHKRNEKSRTALIRVLLGVALLFAPAATNAEWVGNQYMPITWAEALDPSTLNIQTSIDKTVPSRTHTGSFRAIKFTFHSHHWGDEDWTEEDRNWTGKALLAVPETFDPRFDGRVLAMVPGNGALEDYDRNMDLLEFTAMEWGIPVMIIPFVLPKYGINEIHALRDFMNEQAWELLDLEWAIALHTAAARSRGVTAAGELIGREIDCVVHFGSSIESAHSWVWTAFDSRAFTLVHSGDMRWPEALRPPSETTAPQWFVDAWVQIHQPLASDDPSRFDLPMMLYYGTNDGFIPLRPVEEFMNLLPRKPHLVFSPNHGHGTDDPRALESFRMWLDHRANGRPLSAVTLNDLAVDGDDVLVVATISGGPDVEEVNFYYATYSDPNYLESHHFPTTPWVNYRDATWIPVPMTQQGDQWVAAVDVSGSSDSFLAGYVDVKDSVDGEIGYASSPFDWVQIESGS